MAVGTNVKLILAILPLILGGVISEVVVPTITVVTTPDELQVSWTPVVADEIDCFVVYIFSHKVAGVEKSRVITEETERSFPFQPCVENTFIVDTRCRTGAVIAEPAVKTIFSGIRENTQVKNLVITNENNALGASWNRPDDALACDVTYHVSVSIGETFYIDFNTTQNNHFIGTVPLPPCALFALTVTPFDVGGFGLPNTAAFVGGAGNAGGIQDLIVNNGRIEWSHSQNNAYCDVIFGIIIRDNFGNQHTFSTTQPFLEFDFVPCAIYTLIVNSRIGDTSVTTLHANHRRQPVDVGEVQNLVLKETESGVLSTWSPIVIGVCEVKYKLRHYLQGALVDTAFTPLTSRELSTNYCAEHLVQIQAVVDMRTGPPRTVSLTASSTAPEPVVNLQAVETEFSISVSWNPVVIGFCPIIYTVQHLANGQNIWSVNVTDSVASLLRIPCSNNEIEVRAVAGSLVGAPKTQRIDVSIESLDAVEKVSVREVEGGLFVSWSPIIKGLCKIVYRITNFDGDTNNEYETDQTSYTIGKTTCANNTVTVVGVESVTSIVSAPAYYVVDVDIDLTKVRNLAVDRIADGTVQIDWERPAYSEHCTIDYIVHINVGGNVVLEKRTDATTLSAVIEIEPCKLFEITVTPRSPAGHDGVSIGVENTAYLFDVQPVNSLLKHQGTVTWDRPHDVGICDLIYRVVVQEEGGSIIKEVETRETEINFEMVPCRHYTSYVKAIDVLTNLVSERIVVEGTGEPRFTGEVTSLEYELAFETLEVTWNPASSGVCVHFYEVVHAIDGVPSHIVTSQPSIVLNTISCSANNIIITPFLLENVIGNSFESSIVVELDVLEPIQDITVNNNRLAWNRPQFSGNCLITYRVEIFNSNGVVIYDGTTNDLFAEWTFVPCYNYKVQVTPQHNGRVGSPTELLVIGDEAAHAAPTHVKTIPSLASAHITLQANSWTENSCPINAVRIICNAANGLEAILDRTIEVLDNPERIFDIDLDDLPHNTHFSCKAQWWLPHQSNLGTAFEFLTMDIPTKELEISDVTPYNITVSWEVPEGLGRYILYFIVVVTTVGPNHFVQESCNLPRNSTQYIQVPATVLSYTITNTLPSFKYNISLITRYNIGIDSFAEVSIVNTPASVPGLITDLQAKFGLEECSTWSGQGAFVWTPPCDINGELNRFEVTVGTSYTIGNENRVYTANTTLLASDADADYLFSAQIPTLNPFFTYNVTVKVFGVYPGNEINQLSYVLPPAAYTYCSVV